jgi:hypothetical protein
LVTALGAVLLAGGLTAGMAPLAASATPTPCGSGSSGTSGTCTLYTPNGTFNVGGTVAYSFDSGTGQTSFTVSLNGSQGSSVQSIWLCVGPNNMDSYLSTPANSCTPNGVLAKSPNQLIHPVSSNGNTYVFAIPAGDFWFMHLGTGAATLLASAPGGTPSTGKITVLKKDNQTAAPLDGAGFSLLDSGKNPTGQTCVTSAGSCSFDNVAPGNYWVQETTAPPGYNLPATTEQQVSVTSGATVTVTFQDSAVVIPPANGSIQVTKTDGSEGLLAGAGFQLLDSSKNPIAGQTCTTDSSGTCTFDNVAPGDYWVEETTAPPGFTIDTTEQPVTVSAPCPSVAHTACGVATVTFTDTPIPATSTGTVTVRKTDVGGGPLTGAVFTLYTDAGGAPGTSTGISCQTTTVVNNITQCTMTGVQFGAEGSAASYWVVETTAPAGYSAGAPQLITVSEESPSASVTFVDDPVSTAGGGGTSTTTPVAVAGATTVHTGEPFAGSRSLVVGATLAGLGLLGLGELSRRRARRTLPVSGDTRD